MNHPVGEDLETLIQRRLAPLREAPERNPEKAAQGRNDFLIQARRLAAAQAGQAPVSATVLSRLNGWIARIRNPFQREERYSMFATLSSILVILALVFGGAGATVYAAQDSLPDQWLYPIKTATEDVRLELTRQAQQRLELALSFADRRVGEIVALRAAGEAIPQGVANRLESQINLALRIAAGMDPEHLPQALLQIRSHLARQERLMEMAQNGMAGADDPLLSRVRAMLREQNRRVEQGLQEPERFRYQWRNQVEDPAATPSADVTGSPAAPGNSYGPGPGAGLGTSSCGECTPVMDGSGPGPGPGPLQYGKTPEPNPGQNPTPQPSQPAPGPGGSGDGNGGNQGGTQEPSGQNGGGEQGGNGDGSSGGGSSDSQSGGKGKP